jgi:glutamate carboxypeptidase
VGLSVAGPHSRALLQSLMRDDLSTAAFPFMSFRRMQIGMVPGYVGRVSFTGDLGYEIWMKPEHQRYLFDLRQNFEPDGDTCRPVGAVLRAELDALGFTTHWVDGASFGRAGHLVAERSGTGPRLLVIGHLDTVFEPSSPFQRFERLNDATAHGPGVIDMKGGDVIIVQALKALDAAGVLKTMNVVVVMTGDEEEPGRPLSVARAALVAAAKGAAVAIGFEDGDGDPAHAVVARRGTTSWVLTVKGTPAHSSQIFSDAVGAGAIFEASRVLNAFREQLAGEPHLTFNPGVMLGGTTADLDAPNSKGSAFGKTNVVAERATVTGDLRALTMEQFAKAEAAMKAIVAKSLPRTSATLVFDEGYPPLAPSAGNDRLLSLYVRASRDLGLGGVASVSPDKAGAADVAFVAGIVPMIIDAVGLKGQDDHTPGETADLSTLPTQVKRAAVLLSRLARGIK